MTSRTRFLPRLLATALFGVVPIVGACGGRVVSLGTSGDTSDKLSTVETTTAQSSTESVGACPAGFAHPNICCEATPDATPTCGAWEDDPFRACDSGWSTYPNALQCCSLSHPTDCVGTPASDAGAAPPSFGCGFTCPPGWYETNFSGPTPSSGEPEGAPSCCIRYPDGSGECVSIGENGSTSPACGPTTTDGGVGVVVGPTSPPPVDAAPPIVDAGPLDASFYDDASDEGGYEDGGYDDDGGEDAGTTAACDAGVSYPGYDGGAASLCGACPSGWSPDAVDPVLCCRKAASDVLECFSQASGSITTTGTTEEDDAGVSIVAPPPTQPTDAGTTVQAADAGRSFCEGDSNGCGCLTGANGNSYSLDCALSSNGTSFTCYCEVDQTAVSQFTEGTTFCDDLGTPAAFFSSSNGCGFAAP